MAAPLRSSNPGQPQSMQFAHFGVLDVGAQSKASTVTSLLLNLTIGFVVVVISLAHRQQIIDNSRRLTQLVVPIEQKKPEPVKPKIPPPKPKPLPEIAKVEEPKIVVPKIKPPELPKQPLVKMEVKPVLAPPAPKQIIAMAAPVAVSLAHPQAASVPNNDAHPTAVQMGHPDMPFKDPKGPAVSAVNMNSGFPGMNAGNTGHGPPATKVVLGNGSPDSSSIKGNGVIAAVGLPHGVPGGTGTATKVSPVGQQVNLGQAPPPPTPKAVVATTAPGKAVTVISKPKPEYTAEARQMHIEGVVTLRIRVQPNGAVEVVSVTKPLGYGLDDSARRAIMATKFEPATDASGHPIVWEGNVNVTFQLAG